MCSLTKRLLEPGRCHFNFIFYSKSLIWLFADDTSSSSQLFDRGREVKKTVNLKKEKRKIPLNVHQCWNRLNPRQIKNVSGPTQRGLPTPGSGQKRSR